MLVGPAAGGLIQLLAGMWEMWKNNTFAATAFSSYGEALQYTAPSHQQYQLDMANRQRIMVHLCAILPIRLAEEERILFLNHGVLLAGGFWMGWGLYNILTSVSELRLYIFFVLSVVQSLHMKYSQ